jgi:hypothetical protein
MLASSCTLLYNGFLLLDLSTGYFDHYNLSLSRVLLVYFCLRKPQNQIGQQPNSLTIEKYLNTKQEL